MAAALGLAGVLYRAILLALDVPPANSDEGTAGLAALHIGEGRHWPTFFYGQDYMGTFYSYLAAPLIQVFGTHWWVLRLPALAMYAVFLLLAFRLTRTLYTPWFAVLVTAVLALGSDRVIKDQMIGVGGYSDVATAVAGLMLVSVLLALQPDRHRTMFAGWGLLAGYIVWTHWLALPYVVVAALLVAWMSRSALTARRIALTTSGFVLGAAPLLWFNLHHANSLSVLLSLSGATEPAAWPDRLYGAVLLGLPLSSGMCAPSRCATWQMWWGPAYLTLMVVAAVVALVAIRRADPGERRVQAGRLALLAGAALTLAAYVASSSSAATPIESARYLHYAMVSLPAVLWPLWVGLASLAGRAGVTTSGDGEATRGGVPGSARRGVVPAVGGVALLVASLLVANLLVATGQLGVYRSHYADKADEERQLLDRLRAAGLTDVYSEYWTCNRLAYRSVEQVRCAVLDENLAPGFDRYRPYRDQVRQAERVAYVLPESSAMAGTFARSVPAGVDVISLEVVAGYRVYLCRQSPQQN
ncbi:ArnT family glycosyltransferase [Micromonospora carbonacea]|uniref:ArnT family glycosyltransferase n=1 Tax=Micromonospora carbonacea TaxID=47853 RepID=UPI003D971370